MKKNKPKAYLKVEIPAELKPLLQAARKRRMMEWSIAQRMHVIYLSKEDYKVKEIGKTINHTKVNYCPNQNLKP